MSLLCIKPSDNTFFGDGKQFDFGISNVLASKNMPYPSVFFGAIFTALLTENAAFRNDFFEKKAYDHEKILTVKQVYLYNEKSQYAYIKAPLDLFMDDRKRLEYGTLKQCDCLCSSSKYENILFPPEGKDFERVKGKYINVNRIYSSYEKCFQRGIFLIDEEDIFKKNYKTGIKLDKYTKNVEESMLYKIQQTEFNGNDWSYVVEYHIDFEYLKNNYKEIAISDLNSGFLKLGGESKACKYAVGSISEVDEFLNRRESYQKEDFENTMFKILFTSDTFFDKDIDEYFAGKNLKIVAMSNDKPIFVGGYDMKAKKAKQMLKGYSAGTIVFVKDIRGQKIRKSDLEKLFGKNTRGFNQALILKGDF